MNIRNEREKEDGKEDARIGERRKRRKNGKRKRVKKKGEEGKRVQEEKANKGGVEREDK